MFSGFIVLAGMVFWGVFGLVAAGIVCGIIGLCIGFYKKDRRVIVYSSGVLFFSVVCVVLFSFCLVHSGM